MDQHKRDAQDKARALASAEADKLRDQIQKLKDEDYDDKLHLSDVNPNHPLYNRLEALGNSGIKEARDKEIARLQNLLYDTEKEE